MPKAEDSLYEIKKNGSLYEVFLKTRPGLRQFSSLKRGNCKDWVARQEGRIEEQEEETA
jgi:hypothetical protein